ncbi:MAG: YraN family protein [Paludibacteraceae bacterium]|nr:YraN family protein [Paludibacteraceae bacterium]
MAEHTILGAEGERAAVNYLKDSGYTLLHTRWHCGHLELDIVAVKDDTLVVFEVKTRSTGEFGSPADAVSEKKIRRIVNAADGYVRKFRIDLPVRFDIISIIKNADGTLNIEHIEDAFMSPVF